MNKEEGRIIHNGLGTEERHFEKKEEDPKEDLSKIKEEGTITRKNLVIGKKKNQDNGV